MNTSEHNRAIELLNLMIGWDDYAQPFKDKLTAEINLVVAKNDYLVGKIVDGKLTCPKCGKQFEEADDFRHLSDLVEWRYIDRITDSEVMVEGASQSYDESDGNDRVECRNEDCMIEFALPEGLTFEYF